MHMNGNWKKHTENLLFLVRYRETVEIFPEYRINTSISGPKFTFKNFIFLHNYSGCFIIM